MGCSQARRVPDPTPFGDGGWVVDFDADLVMAAIQGNAVEPLTTIGWLMWHIGSKGS
jgi:hypothetical protein